MMSWNVDVGTLFPSLFPGTLSISCAARAIEKNICNVNVHDLRKFGVSERCTVDDMPFGGGSGMVMRADVIDKWLSANKFDNTRIIYMSPRGRIFNQNLAYELIKSNLCILCGRYEGVDVRVLQHWNIEEISIGDFVLFGGELPAMTILETCIRLLPGTIKVESINNDSFQNGLLEHDQYTRPSQWTPINSDNVYEVPSVLLSGHHAEINKWRQINSKQITMRNRPDLLEEL